MFNSGPVSHRHLRPAPGQWRDRCRNDAARVSLASLGACAAFYAAGYLRTRNLAKNGVKVSVVPEKLKAPARLGEFRIRVDCPICLTGERRDGLMRSVEHCLVKNTLLNSPQIEISRACGKVGFDQAGWRSPNAGLCGHFCQCRENGSSRYHRPRSGQLACRGQYGKLIGADSAVMLWK